MNHDGIQITPDHFSTDICNKNIRQKAPIFERAKIYK